jgi:DNA-binding transcriptional LysR family regulator
MPPADAGGSGHLRVGVSNVGVLFTELAGPALRQLRKTWPDLRLSFVQNTSQGLFNDLLEDTVNCAFARLQAKRVELVSHKLSTLEVGVALPPGACRSNRFSKTVNLRKESRQTAC